MTVRLARGLAGRGASLRRSDRPKALRANAARKSVVRRREPSSTSELYHERFCRITDMLTLPILPALLLLTLACLLMVALALWALATAGRDEGSMQAGPAVTSRLRAFARVNREGFLRGRAYARPTPPRVRPGGRGAPRARRRSRRGRPG